MIFKKLFKNNATETPDEKTTENVDTNKVVKHWNTYGKRPPKQWLHSMYIRRKVLLDPLKWHGGCWFNWLQRTYFDTPADKILSLCCGSGRHERRMAQVGISKKIIGMDISEGQLERAKEGAKKDGYQNIIEYRQADIQKVKLPKNQYDMVIVVAGLHHLINLSHVFKQIHRSLKPNGILMITEYVGPDHMDYNEWERELFQRTLESIDLKKRLRGSNGETLIRAGQQTREQAISRDPSEGVNSSLILKNLRDYFKTDIEIEMGNSLLRECLYDVVDNFNDESDEDTSILGGLVDLERSLRKNGLIENHHLFGVYRPLN